MPNYSKNDSAADLSEEEEDRDIRAAYPLMDALTRQECWVDLEIDNYNVFAPKR